MSSVSYFDVKYYIAPHCKGPVFSALMTMINTPEYAYRVASFAARLSTVEKHPSLDEMATVLGEIAPKVEHDISPWDIKAQIIYNRIATALKIIEEVKEHAAKQQQGA